MIGLGSENSEYCDDWWHSKNCYLCHSGLECEGCLYCYRSMRCKDCRAAVFSSYSELCTEIRQSHNCYNVFYGKFLRHCRDSEFLFDCRHCTDCFMCWNLRNKKFCINNIQYTEAAYRKEKDKYDLSKYSVYSKLKQEFEAIIHTKGL